MGKREREDHEEKERKEKRKREEESPLASGSSEDSGSEYSRALRAADDKRSGSKKKDKKKKKKHSKKHGKKHKKGSGSSDGSSGSDGVGPTDLVKQAKKFLKAQLKQQQAAGGTAEGGQGGAAAAAMGGGQERKLPATLPEARRISADDYFAKSAEFTAWLQQEKRLFFNELTSEQTHNLFEDFVGAWNAGQLKPEMYAGTVTAPAKRTTHNWNIKGASPGTGGAAASGARGTSAWLDDQRDKQAAHRALERLEQKKWRSSQRQALDELLPRATGREAVVEKRMARREEAKAREASPDARQLPGGGDPFGDDDSFAAAKAREARAQQQRNLRTVARGEQVATAAAAAQAKENERMAQFRTLLAQGPITIQKRAPPPG